MVAGRYLTGAPPQFPPLLRWSYRSPRHLQTAGAHHTANDGIPMKSSNIDMINADLHPRLTGNSYDPPVRSLRLQS